MGRDHLRVTTAGEKRKAQNITEALEGTSRDVLSAMRLALAKQLDDGKIAGNSIAAAYRELRELDRLIRAHDAESDAEERRASGSGRAARSFNAAAL